MTLLITETTSKLIVKIPGLYELTDYFNDNQSSTGTMSVSKYVDYWNKTYPKNATRSSQKYSAGALAYFLAISTWALQEFESSWNKAIWDTVSSEANTLLSSAKNEVLVQEANNVLDTIKNNLKYFDTNRLPTIKAFELENGSIAFEWIIGHFRIGFNFDPQPEESGYYLISDNTAGEIRNIGHFNGLNKQNIIKSLLVLVLGK